MRFAKQCCLLLALLVLAGCGDNLFPSGEDKRPVVQPGSTGPFVGQKAPDFSVTDSLGNTVTLTSALATRRGIVLYFTMWCPICDGHMDDMRGTIIPQFPDVGFYAVDYVSGTVAYAARSAAEHGFASFPVLADTNQLLLNNFQATMGTTVVIDSNGIIRMNEGYEPRSRLISALAGLP